MPLQPSVRRRLRGLFTVADAIQACYAVAPALSVSGVFALWVTSTFRGLAGPYVVTFAASLFLIVTAVLLSVIPRFWTPRSFGTATASVGISEESDKHIFRGAPRLKIECEKVVRRLHKFVEERQKAVPARVDMSDAAYAAYTEAARAADERTASLYRSDLRLQVMRVLEEARRLFFGPVPSEDSWLGEGLQFVRRMTYGIEELAARLPVTYSAELHAARIDKLRTLRSDGLRLVTDMEAFLHERHKEVLAISQQQQPVDMSTQWDIDRRIEKGTGALFWARFGGKTHYLIEELRRFGLSHEALDRDLVGLIGSQLNSSQISTFVTLLPALCLRIPDY